MTELLLRMRGAILYGSIALIVVGMVLVIAGVLTEGLFLPGVVLIGLSLIGFVKAAIAESIRNARTQADAQR